MIHGWIYSGKFHQTFVEGRDPEKVVVTALFLIAWKLFISRKQALLEVLDTQGVYCILREVNNFLTMHIMHLPHSYVLSNEMPKVVLGLGNRYLSNID